MEWGESKIPRDWEISTYNYVIIQEKRSVKRCGNRIEWKLRKKKKLESQVWQIKEGLR